MGNWPTIMNGGNVPGTIVGPWHPMNGVCQHMMVGRAIGATAVWAAANQAFYLPFTIETACTVAQMITWNGTAVSGNVDVGIYSWGGTRLVSSGSTAQAGTSTLQVFDIANTALDPGDYYMAMAMDNVTGQIFRLSVSQYHGLAYNIKIQASAFPLPATATFANPTAAYAPVIFGTLKATV